MKHLSKFFEYKEENLDELDIESSKDTDYTDIKEELTDMIKKSLKTEDQKVFDDFIEACLKDPEDIQIEGLINDSDVYEFYLKWRTEVDDLLSDINYYDEIPSEIKVFSLYDYIIQGTKKAISETISMIKD